MSQASTRVLDVLNATGCGLGTSYWNTGGGCMTLGVQVDRYYYVVGQDDFSIGIYTAEEWEQSTEWTGNEIPVEELGSPEAVIEYWKRLTANCYQWTCGGCEAPIYSTDYPESGVLRCCACGTGGVDFAFHVRHAMGDDDD